ncbi:four-carbon acid sugar kinase family protein [Dickeya lacustris]|uniref:Four-carbon acid sugar kinase family protein n=1 Tax=Dickeya lacustris TaxID=2259638 RepID=A0ABY8GCJ9_9GAMM|nr:four-carbon acid sugar kinase family protein [Dickeya lacustris]WFN57656.1 four-carbon acid sugar kinase family protein [Dickeya lacustris]
MANVRELANVLVVADDFTGANDAGVGLARKGAHVSVLFDVLHMHNAPAGDAWVVNTDSRALSARLAAERTTQAVSAWRQREAGGWIIKKIDSTLRGNPGAEIDAALTAAGLSLALVAPAAPTLGRITRDGQVWVYGKLLTDTEFASDPKTPVRSACVGERLAEQTPLAQARLSLREVRDQQLAARLQQLCDSGVRLVVLDAESQQDLDAIVRAAAQLPEKPLLAGSAGMSDALARQLTLRSPCRALLAVVGSMSEIAQLQIQAASQRADVTLLEVDIDSVLAGDEGIAQTVAQATASLSHGQHCIVRTCHNNNQRFEVERLCQRHGMNRQQLGDAISQRLGELTRQIVQRQRPGGLYLSGGDIAIAAANALHANGFRILGQIAGCVPWGRLQDSLAGDIPVMTKAGGFGDDATLLHVLRFIEESACE